MRESAIDKTWRHLVGHHIQIRTISADDDSIIAGVKIEVFFDENYDPAETKWGGINDKQHTAISDTSGCINHFSLVRPTTIQVRTSKKGYVSTVLSQLDTSQSELKYTISMLLN